MENVTWYQNWIYFGQLISSLVGFCLIYVTFKMQMRTFKAQMHTFEEQRKITVIEQNKFRLQIRPIFEIIKLFSDEQDSEKKYLAHYDIELKQNIAKNIHFVLHQPVLDKPWVFDEKLPSLSPNERKNLFYGYYVFDDHFYCYNIDVIYEDELGTKYKQNIYGNFIGLKISPPEIIS